MENVYFLPDAHLGSRVIEYGYTQERRLVNLFDSTKHKATAVYLPGDIFDFWYEFRLVVPKGYTRFSGKLSELTNMGVEVRFFTGNHDLWCGDYLARECGVTTHRGPVTTEIYGKGLYLVRGSGLGDSDKKFKLLCTISHSRTLQTLFSTIHPRWSMDLGLNRAKHSRLKCEGEKESNYMGEDKEFLVFYTKECLKNHPDINFSVYGHRHIELDLTLSVTTRILVLGDWTNYFSYTMFDGENLFLENYIEGEIQL